jgi:pantetheine-phosphate adenylyltransferase
VNQQHPHAIYPGSFDPPTNGHLDVIQRAAAIFPHLTVAVVVNPQKREPMFTIDERETMIRECVAGLPNVTVRTFSGLLADFVRALRVDVIVKGLRVVSDFESEMAIAHMNRKLSNVDTMFLMANTEYSFVSSSMVKEAFLLGGGVREFVPPAVWEVMDRKKERYVHKPGP